MRSEASIMHLDLDAFFASVEQRDKPSLRGKPVVVGGVGARGVVATASYEARRFGVRSAMSSAEARARCPHAAFLAGRFDAYREASALVMDRLRDETPLVEPLSLDEAYVDLADSPRWTPDDGPALAATIRADITSLTGLTASVGLGSSKLMAKIASELDKPDGLRIIAPGTELDLLGPLQVTVIPGVGPATADRLRRHGLTTVEDVRELTERELVDDLGQAMGRSLFRLARAQDDRAVVPDRETKSISVEDTFPTDVADRERLRREVDRLTRLLAGRLRKAGLSGRTVTLKVRRHDFATHTRSTTLGGPTDDARLLNATAHALLDATDVTGGLRLLGVGLSGLTDWVQDDLFSEPFDDEDEPTDDVPDEAGAPQWLPGQDVHHREHGVGWVWGSGLGRVTVRFESRWTPPGPIHTFSVDDPDLTPGRLRR